MTALAFGIVVAYGLMSLGTLAAFGWDKAAARRGGARTPEARLHWLALAGGWPGALVGVYCVRHKSRKPGFQAVLWAIVAAHAIGWGAWAWWRVS